MKSISFLAEETCSLSCYETCISISLRAVFWVSFSSAFCKESQTFLQLWSAVALTRFNLFLWYSTIENSQTKKHQKWQGFPNIPFRWGPLGFIKVMTSSLPFSVLPSFRPSLASQRQTQDLSGHCQTSTGSSRLDPVPQCDVRVRQRCGRGSEFMPLAVEVRQCPCERQRQNRCQIECQKECQNECQTRCQKGAR